MFYNGTDLQPERRILRLSDSFEKEQEQPALELTVIVYNINLGYNEELLEACRILKEYAQYVKQVRDFAKEMLFPEAVEQAVDYCIKNGILSDFLSRNRAEAIAMSIFEYDEEKHMKSEREEAENRVIQLIQRLMSDGRDEDMKRALSEQKYREQLYHEYSL
ncbi:MAG: hypothetical protein NC416_04785 [Eubacterium sp.]|nr:hypothetical protein [Eubacterium sp.]